MAEQLTVSFVERLRAAGLQIPVGASIAFHEALTVVDVRVRRDVYWAGRATLVRRPDDVTTYDAVFAACFGNATPRAPVGAPPRDVPITLGLDADEPASDGAPSATPGPIRAVRYSAHEILRDRDFASCTPAELDEAHRLMADLRLIGPHRRSRRSRRAPTSRGRTDLAATLRRALRTGGEAVDRPRRVPSRTPRRIVLLVDVSGSMAPYARELLRFAHVAIAGRGRVEAFAIGTRLTRLTRALTVHDPDAALDHAAREVPDWSGGTRLGDGLRQFNDEWGRRGMARGAIVVILSDGWDRGDPAVLGEQVRQLSLLARTVVWVNPLAGAPGFSPIAAGMAAALPHVDQLVAGHSLGALEDLVEVLAATERSGGAR